MPHPCAFQNGPDTANCLVSLENGFLCLMECCGFAEKGKGNPCHKRGNRKFLFSALQCKKLKWKEEVQFL